ncbi:MAG: hypothetical protein DRP75_02345 [Candidatus Omnitrophota bacterium]|nr:MAG: hypothetical protein DRP75_02345 [Candidatus Omnitrophota bacterium]
MRASNVIVGVSGSIAVYKGVEIVRALSKKGFNVLVVMTSCAQRFVSPLTFQSVSGNSVFTDMFREDKQPLHISLAQKADIVLVAPATANIIGKVANGICDDLLSTLLISTKAKILVAPAMNQNMYENPVVQENIEKLKARGYEFIPPIYGDLVCAERGKGHLAEVEEIVRRVEERAREG